VLDARPPAGPALPRLTLTGLAAETGRAFRAHLLFIALVLTYAAAAVAVSQATGIHQAHYLAVFRGGSLRKIAAIYATVLAVGYVFHVMVAVRPRGLTGHIWHDLTTRFVTAERLAAVLPVLLAGPLLLSSYTTIKAVIPALHPYDWDPILARWETALHGGRGSWEWLQPLLGHPHATVALNAIYNSWFFVLYAILPWQAASLARPRLRMQFLVSSVLLWALLGSLMATLMASAGPAFYGRVTGLPDPYQPLMDYLRSIHTGMPIWALSTQDLLWKCSMARNPLAGCGLSAMPSMHIATSCLFVLLGFGTSRRLGFLFGLFLVGVMLGSVHLGWHYALDDYAAILGTLLIWRLVGWLLDRPAMRRLLGVGWPTQRGAADTGGWLAGRAAGNETAARPAQPASGSPG
jgi:hypothetical protein